MTLISADISVSGRPSGGCNQALWGIGTAGCPPSGAGRRVSPPSCSPESGPEGEYRYSYQFEVAFLQTQGNIF